jgi:hypothetical protein
MITRHRAAARDEMVTRSSSMGVFVFTPAGVEKTLIAEAGFVALWRHEATETEAKVAAAWHAARERLREQLDPVEGVQANADYQHFLHTVATLAAEGRLSRIAYQASRPAR